MRKGKITPKTTLALFEAFVIMHRYDNTGNSDWYPVGAAEHDIIYFNCDISLIPENSEDGKRLKDLGLHVDFTSKCWAMNV